MHPCDWFVFVVVAAFVVGTCATALLDRWDRR